ncbi:MAG: DUF3617 family protein [Hyphomicrobium sp.]|uniref:DUF3617 domain-containing protein n=1 Tax=Hyphomicrobium sp. TaxID=82 RepID=UPI0039E47376
MRIRYGLYLSIASYGLSTAGPCLGSEVLPTRKPGLWQLTTVSDATGMKTFDTCITAADPVITGTGDKNCQTSDVKVLGDERYVDVVCHSDGARQKTSTVLTGDFTTWYRAMSKITFDPPENGLAHMGVTIDGKYLSANCPSETNGR